MTTWPWAWPDPADPENFAYVEYQGGNVARVNRRTLEARDIQPKSDSGEKLRFNWNAPIAVSPNEKGTIYIGAQYLFRSRDHGQSWEKISPDLSTQDPNKQKQEESGGITVDNPRFFFDENLKPKGFEAGKIHLNGYTAMAFARSRHQLPAGDFDRSANQQRVVRGIQARIASQADRPGFIEAGVATVMQHLYTDLGPAELFKIAQAVAQVLEKHHGDRVTSVMNKALRPGKVFIDWSQNSRHKTTVAVYSLRARPAPTVSTPVTWDEVDAAASGAPLSFTAPEVLARVAEHGDLFAPTLTVEQELPQLPG